MTGYLEKGTLSVIIAASNEEEYLAACLQAIISQDVNAGHVQVVVSANGCSDATVLVARHQKAAFAARGWLLTIIDRPDGGKVGALNAGDAQAVGAFRMYLDADIVCDSNLIGQLRQVLDTSYPVYATGHLKVPRPRSWVSRQYGRFWMQLPFVRGRAVGAGMYAVNAAGRSRWGEFPPVIADDSFARLQFEPSERLEVAAGYAWPIVEGLPALVRVRRRQDTGMRELFALYPTLRSNEGKKGLSMAAIAGLAVSDPVGFLVYSFVLSLARSRSSKGEWSRGR